MEVMVTSRLLALPNEKEFLPTHIISISDVGHNPVQFETEESKILRLYFQDICFEPDSYSNGKELYPPTTELIREILTWSKNNLSEDSRLMVHCFAGVSRSSACGVIALLPFGGEEAAVNKVSGLEVEISKGIFEIGAAWFMPNNLMIKYADAELELGGRLVNLVKEKFYY